MTDSRQPVPGSERPAIGSVIGPVSGDDRVQATLVLRRRSDQSPPYYHVGGDAPAAGCEDLAQEYGADPGDLDLVSARLESAGVQVVETDTASRRIRVEGTAAVLSELFGTALQTSRHDDGFVQGRMRSGSLSVPDDLSGVVTAVLGLDDRPQALPRSRVADPDAAVTGYTALQLAEIYAMPEADGDGQTIAIIELGGGFTQSDLDTYFSGLGLQTPRVTAVGVDGATNDPGRDQGADGEVLLDIEVAGAVAPRADILVYFAPNTDAGFLDAVATAAHAAPTPTAISISWGASEDQWTAQARGAMDDAFADAVALGVTVTAAAGDSGSSDGGVGVNADFPASSPHVLGCGGTTLRAAGTTVTAETVWDDGGRGGATGGGVSAVFGVPEWQVQVGVPDVAGTDTRGRGVPDVAANADPQTGYQVYVDGSPAVIGGTSAVAPLWAGLVARLAQLRGGPLGLLQPAIYAGVGSGQAAPGLRDITTGNNGAYQAGPGWDACTGLGVPDAAIAQVLGAAGGGTPVGTSQ